MSGTMTRAALLGCLALGGCAGYHLIEAKTPPLDLGAAPPAGLARVCVLRPSREAAFVTFAVRDNDQLVGATRGGSYFCYHAEPGEHHLTSQAENNQAEAWLSAEAGRSYYVDQLVNSSFQQIDVTLRLVDEAQGRRDMTGQAYRVLVSAPGEGRAPAPVPLARAQSRAQARGGQG